MAAPVKPAEDTGYDIDLKNPIKDFTKLHRACWLGKEQIVRNYLRSTPVSSKDGELRTPLHLAAARGYTVIVQLLMEWGIDYNERDSKGKTPIMKAVECGHIDTAKVMTALGANLSVTDRSGNTAMHLALERGHYDLAQYMLRYLPNCNVSNEDGVTPFHIIAASNKVKLAQKFMDYGASVNCIDNRGRSSLMLACKRGFIPMVALLLKHGCDPKTKDFNGWASLDYASVMGHTRIMDILERYVGDSVDVTGGRDTDITSSSDEEEDIQLCRLFKYSSHRLVPIKMEPESAYLKRQHRPNFKKAKEEKKKSKMLEEDFGIRDSNGKLLPMPELVRAIQAQTNKLGDIHEWLLNHQQLINNKRNDYKELMEQVKRLCREKKRLIDKCYTKKTRAIELTEQLQNAPNIKEGVLLNNQLAFLREGLEDLRNEYKELVNDRDELQNILDEGRSLHGNSIDALKQKAQLLMNDNKVLYDKLDEIKTRARNVTNDLNNNCKRAEDLVKNLKILLKGTYKLLESKDGELDKVINKAVSHQNLISSTRDHCDLVRRVNAKAGKSIKDVDSKIKFVRKRLRNIHKQIENHPLVRNLVDAGLFNEKNTTEMPKKKTKIPKILCCRKKDRRPYELEAEPQVKSLVDQDYDPTGIMTATRKARTVCQTDLEVVQYSTIEDSDEEMFEIRECEDELLNADNSSITRPEESSSHEDISSHLQVHLDRVISKYSRS